MRIEGKVYRSISTCYFILHCIHFVTVLVGCFLPYYDNLNLFKVYEEIHIWPLPYIGLILLGLGCFCAWRTICRPQYCLGTLIVNLSWPVVLALPMVGPYLGAVIAAYFECPVILAFGFGSQLLSVCDYIIYLDAAFVIYMLVLLFYTPKTKVP